jgi:hypothetical protein
MWDMLGATFWEIRQAIELPPKGSSAGRAEGDLPGRHNEGVTPADGQLVQHAVAAFNSQLRVDLLAYFSRGPSMQMDAADHLSAQRGTVSANVRQLVTTGTLKAVGPAPTDARATLYVTDPDRVRELTQALREYTTSPRTD